MTPSDFELMMNAASSGYGTPAARQTPFVFADSFVNWLSGTTTLTNITGQLSKLFAVISPDASEIYFVARGPYSITSLNTTSLVLRSRPAHTTADTFSSVVATIGAATLHGWYAVAPLTPAPGVLFSGDYRNLFIYWSTGSDSTVIGGYTPLPGLIEVLGGNLLQSSVDLFTPVTRQSYGLYPAGLLIDKQFTLRLPVALSAVTLTAQSNSITSYALDGRVVTGTVATAYYTGYITVSGTDVHGNPFPETQVVLDRYASEGQYSSLGTATVLPSTGFGFLPTSTEQPVYIVDRCYTGTHIYLETSTGISSVSGVARLVYLDGTEQEQAFSATATANTRILQASISPAQQVSKVLVQVDLGTANPKRTAPCATKGWYSARRVDGVPTPSAPALAGGLPSLFSTRHALTVNTPYGHQVIPRVQLGDMAYVDGPEFDYRLSWSTVRLSLYVTQVSNLGTGNVNHISQRVYAMWSDRTITSYEGPRVAGEVLDYTIAVDAKFIVALYIQVIWYYQAGQTITYDISPLNLNNTQVGVTASQNFAAVPDALKYMPSEVA